MWLLRLMLTVAVVQIKALLGSCAASEKGKYEKLRNEWLLGCAKHGVVAVRMLLCGCTAQLILLLLL